MAMADARYVLSLFDCASVAATRNLGHQHGVDLVPSGQYHCINLAQQPTTSGRFDKSP